MKFSNNALSIGSAFGIPIRLHISLLIAIGVVAVLPGSNILIAVILAAGVFGSVALHELGHSLVARAKGSYIHEIVLYPFGGAAKISNIPKRPMDEVLVAIAGPAVSLALAVLFSAIPMLELLGHLNYMLFFFNMLPVFPMDGGRVLRALLSIKKGRLEATRVAATVGKYFCVLFVLVGIFGIRQRLLGFIGPVRPNLLLAFIGLYIYNVGRMEYRQVSLEHQADHFTGHHEGNLDVEVSPPPYAAGGGNAESLMDRLRRLFRG